MPKCSGASFIGVLHRAFSDSTLSPVCVTNSNFQFLIDSRRRAGISKGGRRWRPFNVSHLKDMEKAKKRRIKKRGESSSFYFSTFSPLAERWNLFFHTSRTVLCSRRSRMARSNSRCRKRKHADPPAVSEIEKARARVQRSTHEDLPAEDQLEIHPEDKRADALRIPRRKRLFLARGSLRLRHIDRRCISTAQTPFPA